MSFTQFFENLTHEINDSRTGRRARIQEIKTNVENFLDAFRSDHRRMARELKKKLKTDEEARLEAAHEFHGQLHDFASDLRRGGEIFRENGATSSPKESRKKKRA